MAQFQILMDVGPEVLADGASAPVRGMKDGSLAVTEINGRYYEQVKRGQVFIASLQAAVALSTLNATATGLILTNPANSGVDLVLLEILIALASAPAGISTIALAANLNPVAAAVVHTTPVAIRNALLGGPANSVALADSAATLPAAPVIVRPIGGGPVATGSVNAPFIKDEVAGDIIVPPGCAISLTYLTTAISALAAFIWHEKPA